MNLHVLLEQLQRSIACDTPREALWSAVNLGFAGLPDVGQRQVLDGVLASAEAAKTPAGKEAWFQVHGGLCTDYYSQGEKGDPDPCGATYTTGGHDPYGTDCELPAGHADPHRGPDPMGNGGTIEWRGGGSCAGDALPYRDVKRLAPQGD